MGYRTAVRFILPNVSQLEQFPFAVYYGGHYHRNKSVDKYYIIQLSCLQKMWGDLPMDIPVLEDWYFLKCWFLNRFHGDAMFRSCQWWLLVAGTPPLAFCRSVRHLPQLGGRWQAAAPVSSPPSWELPLCSISPPHRRPIGLTVISANRVTGSDWPGGGSVLQ